MNEDILHEIRVKVGTQLNKALDSLKEANDKAVYYNQQCNILEKQLHCKHEHWERGAQAGRFGGYDIEVCCGCGYERCV